MPGFPLTVASQLSCLHQGPTMIGATQTAVTILGQLVATAASPIGVIVCPFAPSGTPQPCLTVQWNLTSVKVTVQGQPLMLMPPAGPAPGTCLGAPGPQGIPVMKFSQTKVSVT